jgi:hypothetical protein
MFMHLSWLKSLNTFLSLVGFICPAKNTYALPKTFRGHHQRKFCVASSVSRCHMNDSFAPKPQKDGEKRQTQTTFLPQSSKLPLHSFRSFTSFFPLVSWSESGGSYSCDGESKRLLIPMALLQANPSLSQSNANEHNYKWCVSFAVWPCAGVAFAVRPCGGVAFAVGPCRGVSFAVGPCRGAVSAVQSGGCRKLPRKSSDKEVEVAMPGWVDVLVPYCVKDSQLSPKFWILSSPPSPRLFPRFNVTMCQTQALFHGCGGKQRCSIYTCLGGIH